MRSQGNKGKREKSGKRRGRGYSKRKSVREYSEEQEERRESGKTKVNYDEIRGKQQGVLFRVLNLKYNYQGLNSSSAIFQNNDYGK